MTATELQTWLRERYPVENECHEWKGWRSLKNSVSGRKGDDLVSYISALANMEGGTMVVGVEDRTLAVTGIQDFADYTLENVKHRVLGKTPGLPSLGFQIEELRASDTGAIVWLVHVPRHAPREIVQAHDKAWQRDGDSLTELRPDRRRAILTEHVAGEDWSAAIVQQASLADLDAEALARAREKYADKHQRERWAADIPAWSDEKFLDKACLALNGGLTHAALLLLGRPERAIALLSPNPAEITWKLPDERVAEHFYPPFILTTSTVASRIRNPNIKLFPADELLATELPRYDNRVLLEALHNCVAHQDYAQAGRIVVEEHPGRVRMTNRGGFIEGKPEQYMIGRRTPEVYRNELLAKAMNLIGMIDKSGFGIHEITETQRRRFLPLPDYEGSDGVRTVFNIYGQEIDQNYSHLLMARTDLALEHVLWLDRVQKGLKLDGAQTRELRQAGLLEGRAPHLTVSAFVATATNTENQYVLNRGFDDDYYKDMILRRLELGPTSGRELSDLVFRKLPDHLDRQGKETKAKNLRTSLRLRGYKGIRIEIHPDGPARGPSAIWRIRARD